MDKKMRVKVNNYISNFKKNIKLRSVRIGIKEDDPLFQQLLQYIYDYENIEFTQDDFTKRKRAKNTVNINERCCGKKSNGDLCSRRKKDEFDFCGTHLKGTPYGINKLDELTIKEETKKVEIFTKTVNGIVYYTDENNNIYDSNSILKKKESSVIGKYCEIENKIKLY